MEDSERILVVQKLSKRFGGFDAVSDFSFELKKGEILGLVGSNGAGKTTVFNLITGVLNPDQGKVIFRSIDITNFVQHKIARLGLARTFQLNRLFLSLTVEENIRIGCHQYEKGGIRRFLFGSPKREQEELEESVNAVIELLGLNSQRKKVADDFPYGAQKLLGIGVALGARPTLLLLDEPFAGMNLVEAERCISLLRQVLERGTTIFIVDHNMRAVMGFCDRIIVLNFGKKIAEGRSEEIQENPEVVASYLGGTTC